GGAKRKGPAGAGAATKSGGAGAATECGGAGAATGSRGAGAATGSGGAGAKTGSGGAGAATESGGAGAATGSGGAGAKTDPGGATDPGDEAATRGKRPRAPVMSDVGRLAGVSHQTVSRVINGSPHVRPETRDRVMAAMEELGYRPN